MRYTIRRIQRQHLTEIKKQAQESLDSQSRVDSKIAAHRLDRYRLRKQVLRLITSVERISDNDRQKIEKVFFTEESCDRCTEERSQLYSWRWQIRQHKKHQRVAKEIYGAKLQSLCDRRGWTDQKLDGEQLKFGGYLLASR